MTTNKTKTAGGWNKSSKYLFGKNPVAYQASFTDRKYGYQAHPSITARTPGDVSLIWTLASYQSKYTEVFVTEIQVL